MTVNTNYKKLALPFASYPLLDDQLSTTYQPIQGMDALARQLSIAQFPGALVTDEGGVNVVTKPPRQNPGAREVIGILDAASAARFLLPTASLENTGGGYVAPTAAGLRAGVKRAVVNDDGVTRSVDLTSKDKRVYPLTLLVSAALSTQADKASRQQMDSLLDYVSGPGQVPGDQIGQLPGGHAPLPDDLLALVDEARAAVAAGPGDQPTDEPTGRYDGGGQRRPTCRPRTRCRCPTRCRPRPLSCCRLPTPVTSRRPPPSPSRPSSPRPSRARRRRRRPRPLRPSRWSPPSRPASACWRCRSC